MSKPFGLRRILAGLILLCGAVAGGDAWALTNCHVAGPVSITVAPCPYSKNVKFGASSPVAINVDATGMPTNKNYYVAVRSSGPLIQPNTFYLSGTFNNFQIHFQTYNKMPSGKQTGVLDVRLCSDSSCKSVMVDVGMPYSIDVVVPPALSGLSPSSSTLGGGAFTLKVNGGGFTRDCKIHFGSTVLTTNFVSKSQLTARVDLGTATKGQTYNVTVVPSTNIGSNTEHFTLKNPLPVVTAQTPTDIAPGTSTFTVTLTGTGFTHGSTVKQGGTAIATHYVSSTEVTADADLTSVVFQPGVSVSFTVSNPTPGGGTSGSVPVVMDNYTPTITAVFPGLAFVGSSSVLVTVNGSGFESSSVLKVGGQVLTPFSRSFSSITAIAPGSLLASKGLLSVSVTNPGPGGGEADAATGVTVGEPQPSMSWVSPVKFYAGSGVQTLTLRINTVSADSVLEWNGTPLTVTRTLSGTPTLWQATVPKALLATGGGATVKLVTPAPGGGSVSLPVTVAVHPPEIDQLSPGFAAPGGSDFTLTLYGTDFDHAATVYWNGDALTTSWVSATELQATVLAAEYADAGVAKLTVVNPDAAGGTSLPASFAVDASGTAVVPVAQAFHDVDWDATRAVFYGSIPLSDATHPRTIASIDPIAASITPAFSWTFGASNAEPRLLSVSSDGSFLYFSIFGTIERYTLPNFNSNQALGLGIQVTALKASPVSPYVVAADVTSNTTPVSEHPFLVFDGASIMNNTGLEPWDTLAWSADGSTLYAGDTFNTGNDLVKVGFDLLASTRTTLTSTAGVWSGSAMHLDPASGLIYADDSTAVVDPTGPSITSAVYPVSGVMIPDSTLGCAYFITQTQAQIDAAAGDWTLSCYSTTDQTLTRSIVIPAVVGAPTKMLRWGNEGLAFITDGGYIYFVSGQVVTGN